MKGIYLSKGRYNARIASMNKNVHLGSFPTSGEAARAYDAACFVLGRPLSSYNNPAIAVETALIHKMVSLLHAKGCLTEEIAELKQTYDDLRSYALIRIAEAMGDND